MTYQLSRNGETYGPYTLDEIEGYLRSGNVLSTDLARSEDMPNWLPVSQIVTAPAPPNAAPATPAPTTPAPPFQASSAPVAASPPTGYAAPYSPAALAASRFPDPPSLHWGILLLLVIVTNGLFQVVWEMVQSVWLKKVQPDATALSKYILAYALLLGGTLLGMFFGGVMSFKSPSDRTPGFAIFLVILAASCSLSGFVITFVAHFSERASLERHFNGPEPVGLHLSGVMTFFFGAVYFQYHLNRITALKQAARMGYLIPR